MGSKKFFLNTPSNFPNKFSSQFDGALDFYNWGDIANFERTQAFSLVCWIKTSASGGSIISRRDGSTAFKGLEFNNIAGQLEFNLTSNAVISNRIRIRTTASTFNNNVWYLAIVTYDGSSLASGINIYVNGINQTLDTPLFDNLTASILINIDCNVGARNNGENFWNGKLDRPAIYNKELSQAEVTAIYNRRIPINLLSLTSKTNLYSWLRFTQIDKDNFPTIADHSGNGRDATASGSMVAADIQGDIPTWP